MGLAVANLQAAVHIPETDGVLGFHNQFFILPKDFIDFALFHSYPIIADTDPYPVLHLLNI